MNATTRRTHATGRRLDRALVDRLAQERGWTTGEEIAEGLGVDRATYYRIRNGTSKPLLETAALMAELAGVPVLELFPPVRAA